MAVADAELLLYAAESLTLGGFMSSTEVIDGSERSVHADISEPERLAGVVKDSKIFFRIDDSENGALSSVKIYLDDITPGDTYVKLYAGNQSDLVADHPAPRLYGVGVVLAPGGVLPGATGFDVQVEADAADIFQVGDTIRLKDDNGYEFLIIDTLSIVGLVVTLTTTTPVVATYTLAANTVCSTCILAGTVQISSDNYTVTSTAGTLDDTNNPVILTNIGTEEESWTITFTSATAYTVTGARKGLVGTGNSTAGSAIVNPDFSDNYMTVPAALFVGTFATGDTVTFDTHPASTGFFSRYEAPAATAPLLLDTYTYCMFGE